MSRAVVANVPIRLEHLEDSVLNPRPHITSKRALDKPWHVPHAHDAVSRVETLELSLEGVFPSSVLLFAATFLA